VLAVCVSTAALTAATGCQVNQDDIHRWETTVHGPDKLGAVLAHDKYAVPLRVEAALSLMRMKPRAGRRVGIGLMVDTLASLGPQSRKVIVASLVPAIISELKKPPPVGQAGQPSPPDGSYPYKDAAFAMLTLDRAVIVADEGLAKSLKQALIEWAMASFEPRLDNRTQTYGMEQLLRFLGADAVAGLPKLMTRDARRLDQMASLVSEIGDQAAKEAASTQLVNIAKYVTSDEWTKVKKPELQAANAASKLEPTEAQFAAQLQQYQDEELLRLFGSMRKVGGRAAIDFALTFAAEKAQTEKRRQAALAALEGRLDRNNANDIKRILEIAATDAPDVVLDQAFRRIGEMPREQVVDKLYELFKTDKWKIRRAAAATVLKMSTVKHLDEFMSKLPDTKGFALPEAITYGALFNDLKEGTPREALAKHTTSGGGAARATAIAYYFSHGTKADLAALQPLEGDGTPTPTCDSDPDCAWACYVPKAANPQESESKEIRTVGDFVRYCVESAIHGREAPAAEPAPGGQKK
jgi:hypothetical protein